MIRDRQAESARGKQMFGSKKNGYSTTSTTDKSSVQALTAGWNVTEASNASYFGNKKWFSDFMSAEIGEDREIVHVRLRNGDFVTLEPR